MNTHLDKHIAPSSVHCTKVIQVFAYKFRINISKFTFNAIEMQILVSFEVDDHFQVPYSIKGYIKSSVNL